MPTDAWGIDSEYTDAFETLRQAPATTIAAIRAAMDVGEAPAPPASPVKIIRAGETRWHSSGEIQLEDGATLRVDRALPPDLPLGYHRFVADGRDTPTPLVVSPGKCPLPKSKQWGWAVQLYAARSNSSWGIGDLADLRALGRWSRSLGASLVMINPLHATTPVIPQESSPYFPTSRRYRNPIYLHVDDIPGASAIAHELEPLANAGRALNENRLIDRDTVWRLKRDALEKIFARFTRDARFDQFQRDHAETIEEFATFCALAKDFGRDYRQWPAEYRHPANPAVAAFRQQNSSHVRLHAWLQWLIELQLADAARELTIMQDLAVGFDPGGADAWVWQDVLARDMSVGAPPDLHNPWGQCWSLPPFVPHKLQQVSYEPFIETIRMALTSAHGLRIDHALGLFRLFWIPYGCNPADGTYVRYPAADLLDIIALEAHRAGAFIVAEDLGTVQESMRRALMNHQMLSYRLLWLEKECPRDFPERSMAAVTTHDLFTVAGLWTMSDHANQQRIGLKPDRQATFAIKQRVMRETGLADDAPLDEVSTTIHRMLADSPSLVLTATLDDALKVEERPNMPGTTDQWPNWRLALPQPLEEIEQRELPQQIAGVLSRREPFTSDGGTCDARN
jgi:4-alpha-glucanotransferase